MKLAEPVFQMTERAVPRRRGLGALLLTALLGAAQAQESAPVSSPAQPAPAACLTVTRVEVQVAGGELPAELAFVRTGLATPPTGCLTEEALARLLTDANNALLSRGYLTTRVTLPEQNVSGGTLRLTLTPGRIEHVVLEGGLLADAGALALRPGTLLRVRDLDQSVETLNRLTSVQASARIEPGSGPGLSVVRLQVAQPGSAVSGSVGVQARPYQSPGAVNVSGSLTVDNPLRRADQLRLSANLSPGLLGSGEDATGSAGFGVAYSLPRGYGLYTLGGGYSASNQARAGFVDILNYGNRGWNAYVAGTWTVARQGAARTDLNAQLSLADSSASLNGTEIEVQRARVVGLDTSVSHSGGQRPWSYSAVLGNRYEYRSNPLRDGVTSSSDVLYGNAAVSYAFANGAQWRSEGDFQFGLLTPQAQPYTISGATVRGAGATGLSSDHGFTLRNAFYYPLPVRSQAASATLYGAADYGFVTGSNVDELPGQQLLGAAVGVQGQLQRFQYDLALGYPVIQPDTFRSAPNVAFSLRYFF